MPSAVSGRQWPAESPAKKTPPSVAAAQLVRDPVALVAGRLLAEVLGQQHGGLLDVEAGVERADADPHLVAGGEGPAVAGGHVAAVDPDLEVLAAARRVDLEPARERRVGGWKPSPWPAPAASRARRRPAARETTPRSVSMAIVARRRSRGRRGRSTLAVSNVASQSRPRASRRVR